MTQVRADFDLIQRRDVLRAMEELLWVAVEEVASEAKAERYFSPEIVSLDALIDAEAGDDDDGVGDW